MPFLRLLTAAYKME